MSFRIIARATWMDHRSGFEISAAVDDHGEIMNAGDLHTGMDLIGGTDQGQPILVFLNPSTLFVKELLA